MRISELWLRERVDFSCSHDVLAAKLTMAGFEVDCIEAVAGQFEGVVVGQVMTTQAHPEAQRLTLCDVSVGDNALIRVVCGAPNVRPGLRVALALPGARLPGDVHIVPSVLRGQRSDGMLCSASELGWQGVDSEGILELEQDVPLGVSVRDYYGLNDAILHVDVTPNRADCLSVHGLAREVAALVHGQIKPIDSSQSVIVAANILAPVVRCSVNEACATYATRRINGINREATTPSWMRERLRRSGFPSIHPVVDVLNYVMIELGQPMHAYDAAVIRGDIQVRFAQSGESVQLLNGKVVQLSPKNLVITDDHDIHALAGIMGSADSGVSSETVDVVLESAHFNPAVIAHSARCYPGLGSEALQRFERGVDPLLVEYALERATVLIMDLLGKEASSLTVHATPVCVNQVMFRPAYVEQVSGLALPVDNMQAILTRLGMQVDIVSATHWQVSIPTYRFDLVLEIDLVEEVLRMHGYDALPELACVDVLQRGSVTPIQAQQGAVVAFLALRGYQETISYSFVDPTLQEALYPDHEVMRLTNPLSLELSEMRVGLWPGLVASFLYNKNRQQGSFKCFEIGVTFGYQQGQVTEQSSVGGLLAGDMGLLRWSEPKRHYDFYDAKGDLEALFAHCHVETYAFKPDKHPALHPGKSARIIVAGTAVGWLGALHPRLMDVFDLTTEVFVFELALPALLNRQRSTYRAVSKYPQVRRDLALLVDESIGFSEIAHVIREAVPVGLLKALDVFDEYFDAALFPGKKSIAVALTLQHDDRTLLDNEINLLFAAILKLLDDKLGIGLRN